MAVKSLAQSSLRQSPQINSMLAGYQTNQFHHLETIRLGGNAASVEFTNLARYADYQHLQIRAVSRGDLNSQTVAMRINGDTGSNYAFHGLAGEYEGGTLAVRSSSPTSQTSIPRVLGQGYPSSGTGVFGAGIIDILDAFEAKNKTIRSLTGQGTSGDASIALFSGLYMSTAAINSITLFRASANFVAGSRFSLYGIKAKA